MWLNQEKWINELWCGDNIDVLKNIPDESVDLIYIDPPFYSNKGWEIIWGNGAERRAFDDRWKGGINVYRDWMKKRLYEFKRILKPTGTLYIHLDWHACHYIKVDLDDVFGYKNFRNEIVWHYSGWNRKLKNSFPKRHDVIFMYGKSNKQVFNGLSEPWKSVEEYVKLRKQKVRKDKNGKKYVLSDAGGGKRIKRYLVDAMKSGKPVDNVWDIDKINNSSKESIGYPTQKPESLMERVIRASTNEGDIVLDAFCGCGTTIAVAEKLNRKWIGIDVSPIAVKVMTERLQKMEKKMGKKLEDFITFGLTEKTIAHIKKMSGAEFEDFIIQQISGKASAHKVHDFGIDGYTSDDIPIQAKNWSSSVGRNIIDNFQSAIRRDRKKKGKIYALKYARGAYEEVSRVKREDGIEIELITLDDFLSEKYGDHTHRK